MFTQSDARRHMIGVRAGTLDDPEIGKSLSADQRGRGVRFSHARSLLRRPVC